MRFRDFHRNVKTRIYVMFVIGIAQAMTTPFMAIYFDRSYGKTFTGLLFVGSILASIAAGAISGYWADLIGRKKILVATEIVFFASYLVTALVNSPWLTSPALTAVFFVIINICFGVYGPVDDAMLLDVTTSKNRQFMYQIFYWGHNLTMALGTAVGAFLFENYRFQLFGFATVAVVVSAVSTIFFIVDTYDPKKAKEDLQNAHSQKSGFVHNYVGVFTDWIFMGFVLAGTLLMTLEFQLSQYIGIRLANDVVPQKVWFLKVDGVKMLGFLQTENTILVVILAVFVAKLVNRIPEKWSLYTGCLFFTVGYSFITADSSPLLLFGAMLIATIGEVMRVPVQQSFIGDIVPVQSRSSYMSINGMSFQVSRVLASLGVLLGSVLSPIQMGITAFVTGLAGILLFMLIMPRLQARREHSKTLERKNEADTQVSL